MGLIARLWQDPVIERPCVGTRGTQQPDLGSIGAGKGLLHLLDWEITHPGDLGQPTSPDSCPFPMTWRMVHSIWQGADHLRGLPQDSPKKEIKPMEEGGSQLLSRFEPPVINPGTVWGDRGEAQLTISYFLTQGCRVCSWRALETQGGDRE